MVDGQEEVFIKAERHVARVLGRVEESKYSVVLDGVNRLLLVDLPKERCGKIDPAFTHVTYRDGDLVKDLFGSGEVPEGERILLHLAYRSEAVVRWQVLPKEG
jgi:hypothetical protein